MKEKKIRHSVLSAGQPCAKTAYDWVSAMIVALVALVCLFTFLFRNASVIGDSMVPTLQDGDRLVLLDRVSDYRYGDIVVIDRYVDKPLIKRIIAVEGDRLDICDGRVYVNGNMLTEPYIQGETVLRDFEGPTTVPEGKVFVMGDNRSVSLDSRSVSVGFISKKDIVGKAFFRIWPWRDIGIVKGR